MAQSFTVPSGTTETAPQTLGTGETGTVESGGTLSTTTAGTPAILGIDNNEITNDGTLTTNAVGADGIFVDNGNTITNSGDVLINGPGSFGINMLDNNAVTNSGTIAVTDPAGRLGIIGGDGNTITITGSGTISTAGIGAPAIALGTNNTLDLSGDITTTGLGGFGINIVDDNTVNVSGTITTTGNGGIGILLDSGNTIDVSGTISTAGIGSDGIVANSDNTISVFGNISTTGDDAFGINAFDNNAIDVSGAISTTGEFSTGIDMLDGNTVTLSSTITSTGTDADGILAENNNSIAISGAITAGGFDADGIEVNDFNRVTNSGLIQTSGSGSADAIEVDDDNTVINTGTLIANGGPLANGIDGESSNRIFNTGSVISAQGAGIDLTSGSSGSFVFNSGFITGGSGVSIDFGPGNDSVTVANGSVLDGLVSFSTGSSSIFFETGNQTITSTGTTPTIGSAGDVFFVQTGDTATSLNQDLLGISELNHAFLDHSNRIHRTIANQVSTDALTQTAARAREAKVASNDGAVYGADQSGKAFWASVYGGFAERDEDGQIPDSDHHFWGGVAGARLMHRGPANLGLFAGYGSSRIDSNEDRTTAEADRFFGGAYGAFPLGQWAMTTSLFDGAGRTDSVRNIANNTSPGGLDAARADIDSFFLGAGLETARVFDQALGTFGLRPAGGIRYAGEWTDGYSETGALAALTVSDRTVHAMSGFAELALVVSHGQVQVDFGVGAEGRAIFGDDSVNVS